MSKRRIFFISLVVVALVAMAGIPIASQFSSQNNEEELTLIAGRNVNMVSGITLPGGDPWLQRQNEPSIAVSTRNPLHLLAGANDYRTVDMPIEGEELPGISGGIAAGDAWLGVFKSFDGGQSWISTLLPGFPQECSSNNNNNPLCGFQAAADPVVRAGTNGLFYYSGIAFNREKTDQVDSVMFVARFIDNNDREIKNEIEDSIKYIDTEIIADDEKEDKKFVDKPWISVDVPHGKGKTVTIDGQDIPRSNVYIVYSVFTSSGNSLESEIIFIRSTDCGNTWEDPIVLSKGHDLNQGATIAVDPRGNGHVYVAWRRFYRESNKKQSNAIIIARSVNGGKKFHKVIEVDEILPFDQPSTDENTSLPGTNPGTSFRTNSYPTIAVDNNGIVYLAWSQRGLGPSGEARIVLTTSEDGINWSSPSLIDPYNNDTYPYQGHQFMPQLSFAAGKLTMVWYDQRNDWCGNRYGFGNWIIDDMPYRHTIDVWVAQADTSSYQSLNWTFTQVSRHLYNIDEDPDYPGEYRYYQVQFNPPNYPLFKAGTLPFHGDYVDISPSPMFVLDADGHWRFNTEPSDTPIFHLAWTDNRDVRPPSPPAYDWTDYTPPTSDQLEEYISPDREDCIYGENRPGMRNQNIYTSSITWGIEAGSPTNTKSLDLEVARAFVIFVKNNTRDIRSFRLTIANQPPDYPDGQASFLQFELLETLDVTIASYSTIARPVFVESPVDPNVSVIIDIDEINYPGGEIIDGGLKSSLELNPDPTSTGIVGGTEAHNPNIVNPNIVNWFVNPNIVNPNIVNPNIVNPNIVNPNIVNPNIVNPNIVNPNIVNPNIVNPNIVNPNIVNPNIVNPNIVNPNIVNPNIVNISPDEPLITDVEWTVKNEGNTTTSYTLKSIAKESLPEGIYAQLLIYRVHYTPAVAGAEYSSVSMNECELKQEPHHELLANIINPNIVNPNIVNPNIVNPNIVNSSIENATFSLAPGDEVIVNLRLLYPSVYTPPESSTSGQSLSTAQTLSTTQTLNPDLSLALQNFINSFGFAVTSQAVNSEDVKLGIRIPPVTASILLIGTPSSLPDGFVGQTYKTTTLVAYGGIIPYTWSKISGSLPPGLSLSLDGVISGTPESDEVTYPHTYTFTVQVTDQSTPPQSDTQGFTITIYSDTTPDDLAITTTSLPDGVVGSWYGATLEATGGVWPRRWSLAPGSLPPGLSLDTYGVISGTPTTAGTFDFTVQVTDSGTPQQTDTVDLSIIIVSAIPTEPEIWYSPSSMSFAATEGGSNPSSQTLQVKNSGGGTLSYTITDDAAWLISEDSGTSTGETNNHEVAVDISEMSAGTYNATITITAPGASNTPQTMPVTLTINPPITTEEWVARYDGPVNGIDRSHDIAVDSSGNAYVTGTSDSGGVTGYDYRTIKYDSSGNKIWEARYDYAGGPERAWAIALDSARNVYVTGESPDGPEGDPDYATIKYDSSGVQQWVARYNGPGNGWDQSVAIAVDSFGNVYVTGNSFGGSESYYDYATIKYDPNGNQLWVARYDGPNSTEDKARAIALDSTGNVYVTGRSVGSGLHFDYATIKYDTTIGSELWVARYDGPGSGFDEALDIVVDSFGNVYVTGFSEGSETSEDCATIKYDTNGSRLWVARYDGPGSGIDRGYAIALDSSGNVYVTGNSLGSTSGQDYATIKYDKDGNELWIRRYNGPGNGVDYGQAITIDSSGNVCVTGYSDNDPEKGIENVNHDYATIKYDSSGNELWIRRYNGPGNYHDLGNAITTDSVGNVYVTGWSVGTENSDYATIKYRPSLEEWVSRYNGPRDSSDVGRAIAVDSSGNIYVTGWSWGSGTYFDYATVKYNPDGYELWVARYDGSYRHDYATAIAVDSSGNVYVTGYSEGGNGYQRDYATIKYDGNSGTQLWVARYDGPMNYDDLAYAIALDSSGNVYVTGSSYGSGYHRDYATIKYDTNGTELWVARYEGPGGLDDGKAIAVDSEGNVYVTGISQSGAQYDFATIKYDTNGTELWIARYDGPAHSSDGANAIALDSAGNVYVTGFSYRSPSGTDHDYDYATVKYDGSNGTELWTARYNGPGIGRWDQATAIDLDSAGNVYVTGFSKGSGTNYDYATVKYDSSGSELWAARYNGLGNGEDRANGIVVDSAGNVYVTGYSVGSGTGNDLATVRYDSSGNEVWVARKNGFSTSDDRAYAIAIDSSGNVYVTGYSLEIGADLTTIKYRQ